jgi:hypothetical protein
MYGASFPSFDNTTGAVFCPLFLLDFSPALLLPGDDIMTDFECIQTTIQQYWTVHIHEHRMETFVCTRLGSNAYNLQVFQHDGHGFLSSVFTRFSAGFITAGKRHTDRLRMHTNYNTTILDSAYSRTSNRQIDCIQSTIQQTFAKVFYSRPPKTRRSREPCGLCVKQWL